VEYDDIIVGGGSAGSVLAARLSRDAARRVLLLEAGPDYSTVASTPTDLQDAWHMSVRAHDWGMTAEAVPGRAIPYPRGRVIGGSSAVNASIALRGVPADYDEWQRWVTTNGPGRRSCRTSADWRTTGRGRWEGCMGAAARLRSAAGGRRS
jgi:choline dehydrogenase-like flavoprotein